MNLFDDIMTGLNEAVEYEKGNLNVKTTKMSVADTDKFSPVEIKTIRVGTGLTQMLFARYMGVSVKTIEAWEAGRNHPDGPACRLLALTRLYPDFPKSSGIVSLQ